MDVNRNMEWGWASRGDVGDGAFGTGRAYGFAA
jgi:hypothetical protein